MTDNQNLPAMTVDEALSFLSQQKDPKFQTVLGYVERFRKECEMLKKKDVAVLGTDEAFVLTSNEGEIKAFKKSLILSEKEGTLVKPGYGDMPYVVSAQGYEVWAEATGTSVIFPKQVLVGGDFKANPFVERDPRNNRILSVYARAIAFKYSSMGIPQVSDWTTIFDNPAYRLIDLLAKAKKFPQCFKVLPKDGKPEKSDNETWTYYPFDEAMNVWINTSHNEVITWLSQILNREKKAIDFAQTFAKRNALKHLSGLQKAPGNVWKVVVLAWRPTGNNIIKWDASQYSALQDRVTAMVDGKTDEFRNQIEMVQGSERTTDDNEFDALEMEVDPEDVSENQAPVKDTDGNEEQRPKAGDTNPESKNLEMTKILKNTAYLKDTFPESFEQAISFLKITEPVEKWDSKQHAEVYRKISELVDAQN